MAALPATGLLAQGPNLLGNPSFETGSLAPWTLVSGNAGIASYGSPGSPDTNVAATIGGNSLLLRDNGGGAIEQVVTPAVIPPGASVVVEAFLGGSTNDWARVVVRFLNSAGVQISQETGDYVTDRQRNQETNLLYRKLVAPIPVAATRFVVRIEFVDNCCAGPGAAADLITAQLVTGSTLPPALPLNTELLLNNGFEAGWSPNSPLTLTSGGWEGAGTSTTAVVPYSNSSGTVLPGIVSCVIDGAAPNPSCGGGASGNFLQHTGDSAIVQWIDARGSTAAFAGGALTLRYGAALGGIGNATDTARLEVRFQSANGTLLRTEQLGPISAAERNYESVLMQRSGRVVVPTNTAWIGAVVAFVDNCCSGPLGAADNVTLRLEPTTGLAPLPLNTNLLPNASFESGSIPGSPLQLTNPDGWAGAGAARASIQQYGAPSLPSATFAAANGLGGLMLQDGSGSALRADIDLRGSAALVAAGRLAVQASAWLGGIGSASDTAEVRVRFETIARTAVGVVTTLPPVTSGERQNITTLIRRVSSALPVPPSAAFAIVELVFVDTCCSGPQALADDVRLVAFDTLQQSTGLPYPGTASATFALATGIDELPRTGLGATVKNATAGQVLRTQVGSPNGLLNGAPVLLALDAFVTGQTRTPYFPDIWVNPHTMLPLYNGLFGSFFAPVVIPMAQGGNVYAQQLPPGLSGLSLLLQAVALPVTGAPSPNGLYFASDAHEIRMQ